MAEPQKERLSKEERRRQRTEAAQRKRLIRRLRRAAWVVAAFVPLALYGYETSGDQELIDAQIVETQRWRHIEAGKTGHDHVRAIIEIEGGARVQLERAGDRKRGDFVAVWVRRGRLTGRAKFLDFAAPGENASFDVE